MIFWFPGSVLNITGSVSGRRGDAGRDGRRRRRREAEAQAQTDADADAQTQRRWSADVDQPGRKALAVEIPRWRRASAAASAASSAQIQQTPRKTLYLFIYS